MNHMVHCPSGSYNRIYEAGKMGRFTQLDATGQGSQVVNGGTPVQFTQVDLANIRVTTTSKVKTTYSSDPKFLQFAGQVMIGNPGTPPTVVQSFGVQWSPHQQYNLSNQGFLTGFFWKLPTGVTIDITLSW
jgi:hypothetical protein